MIETSASSVVSLRTKWLRQILLDRFAPAALLIDSDFKVCETYGDLSEIFHDQQTTFGRHIADCLPPKYTRECIPLLSRCLDSGLPETFEGSVGSIRVEAVNWAGSVQYFLLTFRSFSEDLVRNFERDEFFETPESLTEDNVEAATIIVDERLRLRRFSEAARFFIKVRPVDIGRPLQEIATAVNDHHLVNDLSSVLDGEQAAQCILEKQGQLFERLIMKLSTSRDAKVSLAIIYRKLSGGEAAELELKKMRGNQLDILERNQDLLRAPDIETALRRSLEFLQSSLNADKVAYFSLDQGSGYLTLTSGFGWSRGIVGNTRVIIEEGGELYRAFLSEEMVAITDLNAEPSSDVSVIARDAGVRRCYAKHVSYSSSSEGIIAVYYNSPQSIDETTLHLIEATANLISLVQIRLDEKRAIDLHANEVRSLLDGIPIQIGITNENFEFELLNSGFGALGWGLELGNNHSVAEIFGDATQDLFEAELDDEFGRISVSEATVTTPDHGERSYIVYGSHRTDGKSGFYISAIDITDRKLEEKHNQIITRELDHRVKNMLALISSIAVMTGASYDDYDKFLDAFTARIEVLARTHAELSRKKWLGGDIKSVLTNELKPFVALPSDKISLQGPSAYINARALQSLAMVFHELVTNAIKYGALSEKGKRLAVSWSLSSDELSIQWGEEIEPESECTGENPEPFRTGFGSTVIESTVQAQLRGKLERTLTPQGIRYSIRIPTEQISYKEPLR